MREPEPLTPEEVKDLICLKEACRLLPAPQRGRKRHYSTLYRWIERGRLRAWKLGGGLHVLRRDVYALLQPVKPRVGPLAERVLPTMRERIKHQKEVDAYLDSVGI